MSRHIVLGAVGLGVLLAIVLVSIPRRVKITGDPAQAIADSERAFAALAESTDVKQAFVTWLADDGIVFRPLPVVGKPGWQERPTPPIELRWEPVQAEIAHSGDLGWDFGPSEIRFPADTTRATIHGHFFSVWKKQPDGAWRVACDIGIGHERPEQPVGSSHYMPGPAHGPPPRDAETRWPLDAHLALDRELSDAGAGGLGAAIAGHAARDLRFATEGALPMQGVAAARAALDTLAGAATWRTTTGGVSAARDLAWSCGVLERAQGAAPDSSVYLNVWRLGAGSRWELALAVINPLR